MGDYADCIIKDDKRFDMGGLAPWVEPDNILRCQSDYLNDLFMPIKEKCIGLLTGNHEEKVHSSYQIDFTRNLAKDLGVPYAGYSCFLMLGFTRAHNSRRVYKIHAWHGAGASQTEGARIMRLMRLVNDVEAHIYLMGHLHAIAQYTPDRLTCNDGKIHSDSLVAVITGSWLKTYNQNSVPSYGERAGYKPSRIGCPVITIKPDIGTFQVEC